MVTTTRLFTAQFVVLGLATSLYNGAFGTLNALLPRYVVDVLRGADTERIRQFGHDRLATWGIGREFSASEWLSIVRQLVHRGYLVQDIARYSVLRLTPQARPLLRGEETLQLARPRLRERPQRKPARVAATLAADDRRLFEALRAVRKRLADAQGVPPYVIFGDAVLLAMSRERPCDEQALLALNGVGRIKLSRYGDAFLQAIAGAQEAPDEPR